MTTCERCHRPLKDPKSIRRGYGPVCWGIVNGEMPDKQENDHQDFIHESMDEYIILRRTTSGVATNVPWLVRHHSPTGYEWGYGGSGPADLALNILENILKMTNHIGPYTQCWKGKCYELAYALHQDFKWQFIAPMPREGGKFYTNNVIKWMHDHPAYARIGAQS